MKKSIALVMLFAAVVTCQAGGNHNNHGNQCNVCPAGPTGPQGVPGIGVPGAAGRDGHDGKDAESHTRVIAGVDVRLLDYQHLSLHAFNDYNVRDGRNDSIGARIVIKLGESYEEREMAKMKKQIEELRYYAHMPGIHQEHAYAEFSKDSYLIKRD